MKNVREGMISLSSYHIIHIHNNIFMHKPKTKIIIKTVYIEFHWNLSINLLYISVYSVSAYLIPYMYLRLHLSNTVWESQHEVVTTIKNHLNGKFSLTVWKTVKIKTFNDRDNFCWVVSWYLLVFDTYYLLCIICTQYSSRFFFSLSL